jgi:DNA-binding transcriptional regulator YiaG
MRPEAIYTDPADMPDDERMNPAELKVVREFLGLSGEHLGKLLNVSPRTIRYWEDGKYPIPDGARLEIEALEAETAEFIGVVIERLRDMRDPALLVYRNDQEYLAANPDSKWSASWYRAVAARIAQEISGLPMAYGERQ